MSSATDNHSSPPPHIVLFPSAGMCHLVTFLRLASILSSRNCTITLIIVQPSVSDAESNQIASFLNAHPTVNRIDFQLPTDTRDSSIDPFLAQWEAIISSLHLLRPILSSLSPPLSAVISDFPVAATFCDLANDLSIPNYILIVTSAHFLALMAYAPIFLSPKALSTMHDNNVTHIDIPGLAPYPTSIVPKPFFIRNHPFPANLLKNAPCFSKAKGVLLNTFIELEPEAIAALSSGTVEPNFPPLLPIGPLKMYDIERKGDPIPWLDKQPAESVIYVCFGSRTFRIRVVSEIVLNISNSIAVALEVIPFMETTHTSQ